MPSELLPAEVLRQIPGLYSRAAYGPNAVARIKLVAEWQGRRWYVTHFDFQDGLLWTKYVGPEGAAFMGIHLDKLEQMRGPSGQRVERDESFRPCRLSECEPGLNPATVRPEETL